MLPGAVMMLRWQGLGRSGLGRSGPQRRDTLATSLCRSGGLDCGGRIRNCSGHRR